MNFLQLCQRLAQEAGVTNPSGVAFPTTVQNPIAGSEAARIIGWVQDEWDDLQRDRNWSWMWENPTLTVLAGTQTLAGTIPPDRWEKNATYIPTVTSDTNGRFLEYLAWEEFKQTYPRATTNNSMGAWTIMPDNTFKVNAAPTVNTDITVERYKLPTSLVADTDIPGMPADLHMLIVWRAVVKYAGFDEAGTQYQLANKNAGRIERQLYARCLPQMRLGSNLLDLYG